MSDHIEVALPGGHVVFSTRNGGVSEGPYESLNLGILTDDDQQLVAVNRARLAAAVGLDPESVAMGWQVHGDDVLDWDAPPLDGGYAHPGAELPKVDGHTTRLAGLGLLVLVADCLPVALVSSDRVAMAHCGWRGLASGILDHAASVFDGSVSAAVGPGIGRCCYEVGDEVLAEFAGLDGMFDGRKLDLRAIADRQLRDLGVERVEHVDMCTSCRPDLFFSHRRDNGVTGRQGGLVWREE